NVMRAPAFPSRPGRRQRASRIVTVSCAAVLAALAVAVGPAAAQPDARLELARELSRLLADDPARQGVDDQVAASLVRAIATTLQDRLGRRLLDLEWEMLGGIVRRFVRETLTPERTVDLAASVYARQFDEAELRELLAFQRSPLGRKVARLTPDIARETALAIDAEIRRSPAMPRLVDELQRAFPVLRSPESP
ncbi:MAG: DUF2059 domain-containing protein, partial [Candidatus Rokuibacteriota bacterium]